MLKDLIAFFLIMLMLGLSKLPISVVTDGDYHGIWINLTNDPQPAFIAFYRSKNPSAIVLGFQKTPWHNDGFPLAFYWDDSGLGVQVLK